MYLFYVQSFNKLTIPVGIAFYGVLFFIWHIPAISVEFGVCCYMAFNSSLLKMLYPPSQWEQTLNDPKIEKKVLENEGDFLYEKVPIV